MKQSSSDASAPAALLRKLLQAQEGRAQTYAELQKGALLGRAILEDASLICMQQISSHCCSEASEASAFLRNYDDVRTKHLRHL